MKEIEKLAEDLKKSLNEKQIQTKISQFFRISQKKEIYEELQKTDRDDELQAHPYLLIQDLTEAIKNGNKGLYQRHNHIPVETLTMLIISDFIQKFDKIINDLTKTNKDLYELYTINDNRQFTLTDKNNEKIIETYFIFNTSNPEQNILQIIKEKRIKESNAKTEYPDFAIYLNGIPTVCIEIKSLSTGYTEAIEDIVNKKTYHRFLFCVGTDTQNTFITSNYKNKNNPLWESYGDNKKTENSFFDLATELFTKQEDILSYIINYTFVSENNLINARVQQYFAAKKIIEELKKTEPVSVYFKHHTRSGKSNTFKLILEYVRKNSIKFKKIIILTHDLTVKDNLKETLITINNTAYQEITTKAEFKKAINEKVSGCKIYLTNIQKMESSIDYIKKEVKNSQEYLFLVDENHTHQNLISGYAAVRKIMFPHASYVSATATPVIENRDGVLQDITSERMGKQIDNFTPNNARKLNTVLPCFFKYAKWESELEDDKKLLLKFQNLEVQLNSYFNDLKLNIKDFIAKFSTHKKIKNIIMSKRLDCSIDEELEKVLEILLDEKEIDEDGPLYYYTKEELSYILSAFETYQTDSIKKINSDETKIAIDSLKRELNKKKMDLIVNHLYELKATLPFRPKAFLVVSSIQEGMKFILDLKKHILLNQSENMDLDQTQNIKDIKQNRYRSIRFGIDVSNTKLGEDIWSSEDKRLKIELDFDETNINGVLVAGKTSVKEEFMLQHEDSIDVLIIVGKHLMGFDLKELVTVFLNRYIHDLKLIMQIATRGATIREGKLASYVYDITHNKDINFDIFKKSFDLYNSGENFESTSIAISEDEAFLILKDIEDNTIPSFLALFKIDEAQLKTEQGIIKALAGINSLEDKDHYFNKVKELNEQLSKVIVPSLFINHKDKIRLKTFLSNLRMINKDLIERNELYKLTETQKRDILHENLFLLKIDLKDVSNKIFGEFIPEEVTLNEYTSVEIEIINSRKKDFIKNKLSNLGRSILEKSILEEIENLLMLLNKESFSVDELDSIKEQTEKITNSIKETISNKHDNNHIKYYLTALIDNLIKKTLIDIESTIDLCNVEEYTNIIVSVVINVINETKSTQNNIEAIIETIKKNLIYMNKGNELRITLFKKGVVIVKQNIHPTFYNNLKEELLIFIDDILANEKEIFYFLEN
jgi:hypothetical protein